MRRWSVVLVVAGCASARPEALDTPPQRVREPTPVAPVRKTRLLMPILTVVDATTPVEPPAIRIDKRAGIMGRGSGGFSVWYDGTVQFRGPHCKEPRRGTVEAARISELMTTLGRSGLFERKERPIDRGCGYALDGSYWDIALRAAERSNTFTGPDTAPRRTCAWVEDMLDAIGTVIGANPCGG